MTERQEIVLFGKRERSAGIVAALVAVSTYFLYTRVGPAPTLIIGGSGILALLVWLRTTYRRPVDPDRVLPLYLLLIAAELTHMTEEYLTSFPDEFSALTGAGMSRDLFVVVFILIGTTLALLSAIGLMYGNPLANYYFWFVIIGPGFVNGVAHVLFPLMAGTIYFPGLLTVVGPVATGIVLALRVYRDSKQSGESPSTEVV